jgi:hypothetical protein
LKAINRTRSQAISSQIIQKPILLFVACQFDQLQLDFLKKTTLMLGV